MRTNNAGSKSNGRKDAEGYSNLIGSGVVVFAERLAVYLCLRLAEWTKHRSST